MRLVAVLFCGAVLLVAPGRALAGISATVRAAGIYGENESAAKKGAACAGVHAPLRQEGDTVPAQLLTRFGLELLLEGAKTGAPARLDVELSHPALQQPGKAEPLTRRQWEVPACAGVPVLVAWTLLSDWELAPGDWTFSISHAGTPLLTRTFHVVEGALADPEAQLGISLEPKTPSAPTTASNATASSLIAPEEGVLALAELRDIEPNLAGLVLDAAEARQLAARSIAAGLPATVRPVQRSTGEWQAVVVWDFTQSASSEDEAVPALAVQLASYGDLSEALTYANSLRQYGVQVYIESLQGKGRVLHTVRVGPYDATRSGRDQALRVMSKLHAKGVKLPLLTRSPEPLEHVSWEALAPAAPQEPAAVAQPAPTRLTSMGEAKSRLAELMEMTRPDEMLPKDKTDEPEEAAEPQARQGMQDGEAGEAPDEYAVRRAPGPERWPRNTPPVAEFAKTASRKVSGSFTVQIGPFPGKDAAEAFRKHIVAEGQEAEVVGAGPKLFAVHAGGFANLQAAKAAGAAWVAALAPEAGLGVMVVKEEAGSSKGSAGTEASASAGPSRFMLQLVATASREEAERQCASWIARGLEARVVELPGALGKTYAVRAGSHPSMTAAHAAAEAVRTAHGVMPVVVEDRGGKP